MARIRAIVTDLDNTLYPWVDYIVPSVEAMVDSLVATTGLPRVRIVQSLKAVYSKYESNEYPFAIQESELFKPYEADFDSFNALVLAPRALRVPGRARALTCAPTPACARRSTRSASAASRWSASPTRRATRLSFGSST